MSYNNDNSATASPLQLLAQKGPDVWNRWAKYVIENNLNGEFNNVVLPDQLKNTKSLDNITIDSLSRELGFSHISELNTTFIISNELFVDEEIIDLTGCVFPFPVTIPEEEIIEFKIHAENALFLSTVRLKNITFTKNISFNGAVFSDEISIANSKLQRVYFHNCTFLKFANFGQSIFKHIAVFTNTNFNDFAAFGGSNFSGVDFSHAVFNKRLSFGGAGFLSTRFINTIFKNEVTFVRSTFRDIADFSNSIFKSETNFEYCSFEFAPKFFNATLHQDISFYNAIFENVVNIKVNSHNSNMRAWRVLKIEMNKNHNHPDELLFFSLEMDSKRKMFSEETTLLKRFEQPYRNFCIKWIGQPYRKFFLKLFEVLNYLFSFKFIALSSYKLFSNYGKSIVRPFLTLFASWHLFALAYANGFGNITNLSIRESHQLSYASMLPFISTNKSIINKLISNNDASMFFQLVNSVQSTLSIVLIFLIGLALRHFFTIK